MSVNAVTEEMLRNIIKQEQLSIMEKQYVLEDRTEKLTQHQESLKQENNLLKDEVNQLMLVLQQEARRLEKLIIVGAGRGSTRVKKTSSTTEKRHNPVNNSRTSKLYSDLPKETDEESQNAGDSTVSTADDNLQSWWGRNVCGPLKKKLGKAIDSFFEYIHLRNTIRRKRRRWRRGAGPIVTARTKPTTTARNQLADGRTLVK